MYTRTIDARLSFLYRPDRVEQKISLKRISRTLRKLDSTRLERGTFRLEKKEKERTKHMAPIEPWKSWCSVAISTGCTNQECTGWYRKPNEIRNFLPLGEKRRKQVVRTLLGAEVTSLAASLRTMLSLRRVSTIHSWKALAPEKSYGARIDRKIRLERAQRWTWGSRLSQRSWTKGEQYKRDSYLSQDFGEILEEDIANLFPWWVARSTFGGLIFK